MTINESNLNRLAISLMELNKYSYEQAIKELENLRLSIICGDKIMSSYSLQAALVTAVNTGSRAFLGGVFVSLPENTPALIPWPNKPSLNKIVEELGGTLSPSNVGFTLYFGLPVETNTKAFEVVCNAWQGGILTDDKTQINLPVNESMPLGGIAAGALGVGTAFLKITGIDTTAGDNSTGISLWKPHINWYDSKACGPNVQNLPSKFWLLGLGHLGQSYLWNIGLLPFENPKKVHITLQDFDRFQHANRSSGLLYSNKSLNKYKTRVCASWLEDRNFQTSITERKFDEHVRVLDDEPLLALCGFDSGKSRRSLLDAGFDFIIDCSLGGNLNHFDNIILRTFPNNSKTPKEIWSLDDEHSILNPQIATYVQSIKKENCGILAQTLGSKAISSSFVGALSGALVLAEAIRGLNRGIRYDTIVAQIRDIRQVRCRKHTDLTYSLQLARNGYIRTG